MVTQRYGAAYPGVLLPGNNLWPRKFVSALYAKAQHLTPHNFSLALHTLTPVTSISAITTTTSTAPHRRWRLTTPRGPIACSYVLHATNAYASHLLPHLHGPDGVVPARGQIIAIRSSHPYPLPKTALGANDGFEYGFPRPTRHAGTAPVVILGGGREAARPLYELYETDDSVVNADIGRAMRRFLPAVFPGTYESGKEPEMEWVSSSQIEKNK